MGWPEALFLSVLTVCVTMLILVGVGIRMGKKTAKFIREEDEMLGRKSEAARAMNAHVDRF